MATRSRAGVACLPCKAKKARCSDYRPCSRCKQSGKDHCSDSEQSDLDQTIPNPKKISWTIPTLLSTNSFDGTASFELAQTARGPSMFVGSAILAVASKKETNNRPYIAHQPASSSAIQLRTYNAVCGSDADFNLEPEDGAWAWAWEAEAGPGGEDPFHDDWKRCQLLWAHAEEAMSMPSGHRMNRN